MRRGIANSNDYLTTIDSKSTYIAEVVLKEFYVDIKLLDSAYRKYLKQQDCRPHSVEATPIFTKSAFSVRQAFHYDSGIDMNYFGS